jgi:hypothetical protein
MVTRVFPWANRQDRRDSTPGSVTPILDLLEPLPQPADRVVTGRFALPFFTFLAMIIFTGNLSFLIVPLGFLPIIFVDVAVHEFGHLVAGWCVGLQFKGVEFGPFAVMRIRDEWGFRARPRLYLGQAQMTLRRISRMRRKLAVCILSGPLVSYAFGVGAILVGELCRMKDSLGWTTFLGFLGAFSVLIGVLSSIPFRTRMGRNDAFLLRELFSSKESATRGVAGFALASLWNKSPIVPEFYERWFRLASDTSHPAHAFYCREWAAYRAAADPDTAASSLERLLGSSASLDQELRNFLAAEAAYFGAWKRSNATQARAWFRRVRHLGWLHPIALARLEIAILAAEKEYRVALAKCDSTIGFIQAHLAGPASRKIESEWLNWREQIAQRLSDSSTDAPSA